MQEHTTHLPLALASLCIAALAVLISRIYGALHGPLAPLPGPGLSKWSGIGLRLATATGNRPRYVHKLHERFGSVVRLSPNEVSVTDMSAVKQIYKMGSRFRKSTWYLDFTGNPAFQSLFTMIDDERHGPHRRLVANNFAERTLENLEPLIAKNVRLAVRGMVAEAAVHGHCDIFKWFILMANDVVCEASFAESFGMLSSGEANQYMQDIISVVKHSIFRTEFPLLNEAMAYLFPKRHMSQSRIFSRIRQYSAESIERYKKHSETDPQNLRPTLLSKEYDRVKDGTLQLEQVRRDGVGYIIAGTDTTASAATYAVWLLAQHPEIERAVCSEVRDLPEDFTNEQLGRLPTLLNVINETLRLRAPVSQSLPRIVPTEGLQVQDYYIPAGCTIGVQAWSVHRKPEVWPEPEKFNPDRWNDVSAAMRENFLPFGGGSRICVGMHFAYIELRHALASFYRAFDTGVQPSCTDGFSSAEMKPMSYFVMSPKGKRCLMQRH